MVQLAMTPSIVSAIRTLSAAGIKIPDQGSGKGEPSLDDPTPGGPISHRQVVRLASLARQNAMDEFVLEKLLRRSDLYIPPPESKPEPSVEYRALMEQLRRDAEEQAYQDMLNTSRGVPSSDHKQLLNLKPSSVDDDFSYGDVNRQLALVFNLLFTVLGVGIAVWLVTRWWATTARIFLALGGSIAVGIAEVLLYMMYEGKKENAKAKETARKEKKEVLQRWIVRASKGDGGSKEEAITTNGNAQTSSERFDGSKRRIATSRRHIFT